jgi:hypothetical protein
VRAAAAALQSVITACAYSYLRCVLNATFYMRVSVYKCIMVWFGADV